jgi:hypothetical protein
MIVEMRCCEGEPSSRLSCLKERCPIYESAKRLVDAGLEAENKDGQLTKARGRARYLVKVRRSLDPINRWDINNGTGNPI